MAFIFDIRELVNSGEKMRAEREKPVRIAVYIDAQAPEAAVQALKDALRPQTGNARLHVEAVVPGDVLLVDDSADVVIALAGPGDTLAPSLARAREKFVPTVALVAQADRNAAARRLDHPVLDTLAAEEAAELVALLGAWLEDRVSGKRIALAANFEFVRRAVAVEAVKTTSLQNGVVGGVVIIPGADMPIMTLNQAKMVMQIAAAYGQPLGAERIKELAMVVGGGFALRAVARQALTLVPGFGWAIKAGIGYSGTLAMGYAAIEYFEQGGDASGLAVKIAEARDKAVQAVKSRGPRSREVVPAHAYVVESGAQEYLVVEPVVADPVTEAASLIAESALPAGPSDVEPPMGTGAGER